MALIQKTQFKDYVDFSDNIPDKKLNYQIDASQIFDFKTIVPKAFYDAIVSMVDINIKQWSRTTPYSIGDKIYSPENQQKYIALRSTTGDEPSVSSSDWQEIELYTLFDNHLKPFLICSAFSRYLLWTGRNISQFGIRTNNEDSSTEISDKARAELIADIENQSVYYWSGFLKQIKCDSYTYDGVTYDFNNDCEISRPKRNFKIRAV